MRRCLAAAIALACGVSTSAWAKDTQFWNLTANTITALQLSPAGQNAWGAEQTINDSDHSVDHDERLKITSVKSGVYDVRFTDQRGRQCVVKNVAVKEGAVFTIEEKTVANCQK